MTAHIKAKATRHETNGIWHALLCHIGCAHFLIGFDQIIYLSTAKALLLETSLALLPIARLAPLSLVAPTPRGGCKGVGGRCRPCWSPKRILTCTAEDATCYNSVCHPSLPTIWQAVMLVLL